MARLSEIDEKPRWVAARTIRNMHDDYIYADVAVQAEDGWVHLGHFRLFQYQHHDNNLRKTRLEILREAHEHITIELAKLTLETT